MEVVVAHTNKVLVSSVRGAGYPQAAFVIERLLDCAARELRLDPAELRRRNLIPADQMPYELPLKARSGAAVVFDSGDYPRSQAILLDRAGWAEFRQRQRAPREAGRHSGPGSADGRTATRRTVCGMEPRGV